MRASSARNRNGKPAVHQFLPSISYGDAISNHVRAIQQTLLENGYQSGIFAEHIHPSLKRITDWHTNYAGDASDMIIYHLSIGSAVSEFVRRLPNRRIIIYHNITPSHYFEPYKPGLAQLLRFGRQEMRMLLPGTSLALGDSAFNEQELKAVGYKRTGVLPIIVHPEKFDSVTTNRILVQSYRDDWTNVLFVGRISPNKGHTDLIKAFYLYKTAINLKSRLFIVGSWMGMEAYKRKLELLVAQLKLSDVHFTGVVPLPDLATYYKLADVFVSMSEHEGFLVPLIEAMHCGVPVIAYAAGAVPGTLGKSGVTITNRDFELVAHMIDRLVTDQPFREYVIALQRQEAKRFAPEKTKALFLKYLSQVITPPA